MKVNILTSRTGGPLRWGKDLCRVLRDRKIDARHFHTLPTLAKNLLYQDAGIVHTTVPFPFKLWHRPVVLTLHGEYSIEQNIWHRLYPKAIAQADAITVPSRYLKGKLGLHNAMVIPNALFPEQFTMVKHAPKEHLNLVSVTNFHFSGKAMGVLEIIEVLNKIPPQRFNYTVVGGGKYLDIVENQISGTRVGVKFTGFLPDPKPTIATSDVFLYCSYQDSFAIVILEAMASGLPVITNDIGAASQIIENGINGYIAKTAEDYSDYLLRLMDSPSLRQSIGFKARQTVEEKFNWLRMVDLYVQLYSSIL